jgi:hypothetical protein
MKTKTKKRKLKIGDNVKEISTRANKRIGEVVSILEDSKTNPTFECIEVHPKHLAPLEGAMGKHKTFRVKKDKCKYYVPRKNLFKKETFKVGNHISNKMGGRIRYGMIMGYLNQEEGLYPHSYDAGEYNGKDLLECVEVDPKPGLHRMLNEDGNPKKFVVDSKNCKIVNVIKVDDHGKPTTALRLDVPKNDLKT